MSTPAIPGDSVDDYMFDLHGYRVLRGALSPQHVAQVNRWIDAHPAERDKVGQWIGHVEVQTYMNEDGVNYQNIIEAGAPFHEFIDHHAWFSTVQRYIGNFGALSLNECLLNVRQQGGYIGMHSGGHMNWFTGLFRHPLTGQWFVGQINVLVALTDIGPGDGATTVVPGSHKSPSPHPHFANQKATGNTVTNYDTPASDAQGMIEVHLQAGDALLFTDGITHGSTARRNPGQRRIMLYRYCPAWCNTRFNYIPSQAMWARLTPQRRKIVMPTPPRLAPGQSLDAGTFVPQESVDVA